MIFGCRGCEGWLETIGLTLSPDEMAYVREVTDRLIKATAANKQEHNFPIRPGQDPEFQFYAQCAEYGASVLTGLRWNTPIRLERPRTSWRNKPDLGEGELTAEVRHRLHHHLDMVIRLAEHDARFIHVTGRPPNLIYRGWAWAHDVRQPQWFHAEGGDLRVPCDLHYIPASALHSLGRPGEPFHDVLPYRDLQAYAHLASGGTVKIGPIELSLSVDSGHGEGEPATPSPDER